jgi:uncharacterized membrane-anchored protein YjiN (DUF445 family)
MEGLVTNAELSDSIIDLIHPPPKTKKEEERNWYDFVLYIKSRLGFGKTVEEKAKELEESIKKTNSLDRALGYYMRKNEQPVTDCYDEELSTLKEVMRKRRIEIEELREAVELKKRDLEYLKYNS